MRLEVSSFTELCYSGSSNASVKRKPLITTEVTPTFILPATGPHFNHHSPSRTLRAASSCEEPSGDSTHRSVHNITRIAISPYIRNREIPLIVDTPTIVAPRRKSNGAVVLMPVRGNARPNRIPAIKIEAADALADHQANVGRAT